MGDSLLFFPAYVSFGFWCTLWKEGEGGDCAFPLSTHAAFGGAPGERCAPEIGWHLCAGTGRTRPFDVCFVSGSPECAPLRRRLVTPMVGKLLYCCLRRMRELHLGVAW